MDKKVGGGLFISVLAFSSFIGFYLMPSMASQAEEDAAGGLLPFFLYQTPYNQWALIIAPSHSFYQEFVDLGVGEATFDNILSTQWSYAAINGDVGWNITDGWNETNVQDAPCVFISNETDHVDGYFSSEPMNLPAKPNMFYTLTVWINCTPNASIGLQWKNSSGSALYTNLSLPVDTVSMWKKVAFSVRSPADAAYVNIILEFNGTGFAKFDHVILYYVDTIDNTSGMAPIQNADPFAAQAIQAYLVLRSHGYGDHKIMLMINSGDKDVRVFNHTINDYNYIESGIDYEGNDVNKSTFLKELNASVPNSWASHIRSKDELIVYLIGHGSKNNPDGNVTFHFETGENVSEQELDDVLKTIACSHIILLADMDFAGNFIQPILSSASNRVLIASSSENNQSIYWLNATPAMIDFFTPQYAGSFFFHGFWDVLNISAMTLSAAFEGGDTSPFSFYQYAYDYLAPKNLTGPIFIDRPNIMKHWILPFGGGPLDLFGAKKWALIIAASNTLYQYNYTTDGNFDGSPTTWSGYSPNNDVLMNWDNTDGQNESGLQDPGCLKIENLTHQGYGYWFYQTSGPLLAYPNVIYTIQAYVNSTSSSGPGAYLSLNFTNSSTGKSIVYRSLPIVTSGFWDLFAFNVKSPDWANGVSIWLEYNGTGYAKFDTVKLWYTDTIENTTGVTPTYNSDEFPAQAIQAYEILQSHGFDDSNIMLMINSGDNDVRVWDPATNNYMNISAHVDVAGADVNKSRFLRELDPLVENSFAHSIDADDELIIYMVGQGSNNNTDGNASYHFDTGGNITEFELDSILKKIFCPRKIIMVDMNYAGNFITGALNSTPRTLIASSGLKNESIYWTKASFEGTAGHPAGSLFYNAFWNQLDSSDTLQGAFTYSSETHIPYPYRNTLDKMQSPIYYDGLGIWDIWTLDPYY
ncbi:MAG: C13 family peptidase [Candidatus Helarchaeota archaeon]